MRLRYCLTLLCLLAALWALPAHAAKKAKTSPPPDEELLATLERVVNLAGEYLELLDQPEPDVVLLGAIAQELSGYQLSSWNALHRSDKGEKPLEKDAFNTHLYILSLSGAVTTGLSWTWFSDSQVARDIEAKGQWKTATELGIQEVGQFLTEAGFVLFSATAQKVKY